LAKKYNIPHLVGFGTFWVYDYPEDIRDEIIEKNFKMKVKPPIDNMFKDKEVLDKLE